jgi:zinc transport system substrate-binding protein
MAPTRLLPTLALALGLGAASALTACGSDDATSDADAGGALRVAAAFYPIEEAVQRVGGDRVEVIGLTPPGTGPHDLELTPKAVTEVEQADAVVYLSKGFQPAVEDVVAGLPDDTPTLDVLDGIDLLQVQPGLEGTQGEVDGEELEGGYDPHVWVDPSLQAQIAANVESMLSELDPEHGDEYAAALATYTAELETLGDEFATGLETCESRTIVTSHRAFAYLAEAYDLRQIPIAGISPDEEPDPRSLEAVADAAEADGVTVIFFESAVPKDLAETVANEIGAETDFLQPVETIAAEDLEEGVDYAAVQRQNLASLEAALRCS